jgi:hypothetical protein
MQTKECDVHSPVTQLKVMKMALYWVPRSMKQARVSLHFLYNIEIIVMSSGLRSEVDFFRCLPQCSTVTGIGKQTFQSYLYCSL